MSRLGPAVMLAAGLVALPAEAQAPRSPAAGRPVRVVTASGKLPSAVAAPLHFRLQRLTIPAGQSVTCAGPDMMLYALSGGLDANLDGEKRVLRGGSALFVAAGQRVTFAATPAGAAAALHFLLSPAAERDAVPCPSPASATELYRTPRPIPGLKPGPYEFIMTRVTVEKGVPRRPMHHRSGAALYYVVSGTWSLHHAAGVEPRTQGAVQFEPHDFVHTWENVGDTAGVLLQAHISPEGTPEIIFVPPR